MPNSYRLIIPRCVYEKVIRHARQEFPAESCGLLAGRVDGASAWVCDYFPLVNAAVDPLRRYRAELRQLFQTHRVMRQAGWQEVAVVHSHPCSPAVPSRIDLADNAYGESVVHLIVSLQTDVPEVRVWRLKADSFDEVSWHVVGDAVDEAGTNQSAPTFEQSR